MAAAILKQRQAGLQTEPQTAAAPEGVGPMGVDYNANYAGGGIIAFAKGKEIPFIASANDDVAGETEAKKAMASGIVPARAVVPIPANDANAGEAEAKQAMASGIVPARAPAGILAAPPVETDPGRAAIADAKKAMEPFSAIANKPTKQLYEEEFADRKALGLDNSEAKQKLMQQQMAERANLSDEAYRTNQFRRAQFFAEMASTPGNTLVAGMIALKNRIPDILQDSKDQKLARQQADKAIFDLEESMRMEKLGVYDKADARKQAAIKTMADLQASLTTASVQQASSEKQLLGTQTTSAGNVAASAARDAAGIQQQLISERSAKTVADIKAISDAAQTRELAAQRAARTANEADSKLIANHAAAQAELTRAIERAERLRSGKDYQASLAIIQQATQNVPTKPDGTVDETKINPVFKANYDKAKANIERADIEMKTMVENADKTSRMAFSRLKIPEGAAVPAAGTGQGFPAPPAEAIGVLKNGNTPQARAQFDQIFGPGAAAKALGR
jgi:hypothetical protein